MKILILLTSIVMMFSCKKEELPNFCKCYQEHQKTLDGINWYSYSQANTIPKDDFCESQVDTWIYISSDQRYKYICN